jgi:hypothetical protein
MYEQIQSIFGHSGIRHKWNVEFLWGWSERQIVSLKYNTVRSLSEVSNSENIYSILVKTTT